MTTTDDFYQHRPVLVTGGAGFIGSNLVQRLVALGARVTVVDSLDPCFGGNPFNLEGARDRIALHILDLRDQSGLRPLVQGQDIVFHLAGQVSHEDSMRDPLTDLGANAAATLSLLETCRRHSPSARIVSASTRQVYGRPQTLPVDEEHPVCPVDVNGVNKAAAESYHRLYHDVHGMWTCVLRLTNTYGPRQLIRHARQGFIAWFVLLALQRGTIQLFGDGRQQRDLTYVDDVVEALLAACHDEANGQVFNLGGELTSLLDLAKLLCELCPDATYETVPFPDERRRIDIGSYVADGRKIERMLEWRPRTDLRTGLKETLDYYRTYGAYYT